MPRLRLLVWLQREQLSDTQIVAPIPSGTTTGHLIITVNGVVSNSVTFAVPVIIMA